MEYEFQNLISNLFEGVYVVDQNRKIIFWNTGSERITGYKSEEVVNQHCYQNILQHVDLEGNKLCLQGCPLHATLEDGKIREANVFLHHKSGHRVPITVKTMPLRDESDKIVAAIEVFTDNRYRENVLEENRELRELLTLDALTNLPNRRYIDFYLKNIQEENEEFGTPFGILFIDIDDFKNVNDTYGHNVGDDVLRLVSNTLKSNVRNEDLVGRWGGEEMIAILKLSKKESLFKISEKLRMLVESSYMTLNEEKLSVTVSIGGTMYVKGEKVLETIDRSDKLMYESKQTGKNKSTVK